MGFGTANIMNDEARSGKSILIVIESFFHRLKQGLPDEKSKTKTEFCYPLPPDNLLENNG
jgi:hypothetical protein